METLPREECEERVCRVHSTRGVRRGCWVDLTASAESSEGIKHPRAQGADKTKHNDLGYGVIVNTTQAFGSFIHGNRVIIRDTRTATFLVGRTGHDKVTRKGSTVRAYGLILYDRADRMRVPDMPAKAGSQTAEQRSLTSCIM
jgi:hypothetical protein